MLNHIIDSSFQIVDQKLLVRALEVISFQHPILSTIIQKHRNIILQFVVFQFEGMNFLDAQISLLATFWFLFFRVFFLFHPIYIKNTSKSIFRLLNCGNLLYFFIQLIKYLLLSSIIKISMENMVSLMELSIDQIVKRIKAYKNDPNIIGISLIVKRKQTARTQKKIKSRRGEPNNIDVLLQKRKVTKEKEVRQNNQNIYYKQHILHIDHHDKDDQSQKEDADPEDCGYHHEIHCDNRMSKARSNYLQGNYQMAISILNILLQQAKNEDKTVQNSPEGDNQRKIASITFFLGNCYYRIKNYEKAIEYYSMQIPEENYKYRAMRKSNLGAIYLSLKKNQQSLRNYTQALKIYSQCGREDMDLSNIYYNVGNIYLREKMYDIAQKYFQMSIQERKTKSVDAELPLFYSAFKLGLCQKYSQKYEQSIKSLFYALSFTQRGVGDPISVQKQIALVNQLVGKNNEALNYYEKICDSPNSTEEDKGYAYERAALIYIKQKKESEGQKIMKIAFQCYEKSGNERKVSFIRQNYKISSVLM